MYFGGYELDSLKVRKINKSLSGHPALIEMGSHVM